MNEKALFDALRNGEIAAAGLDVYDIEPLPKDHPLVGLDHVVLSPHLGYSTGATLTQFYVASVENLQAWMHGSPIHVLNDAVLNGRRK